ncbi:hypothetical protein VSQ48_13755 [Candidatus Ventrimonas sp. KK005]|jgi:hypothetical protein|nr:hypothetical protein [Lachnospiraceae bacterium]NBH16760.1 hypothetical protein [Clostridiaceae bacterium]
MEDFKQILKRVNFDGMISYLMYGVSSKEKQEGTYEERVQDAYDRIFDDLEGKFPTANREDDALYDIVLKFAMALSEVYMEMGVTVGFQLFKNFESNCKNFEAPGLEAAIQKNLAALRESEKQAEEDL